MSSSRQTPVTSVVEVASNRRRSCQRQNQTDGFNSKTDEHIRTVHNLLHNYQQNIDELIHLQPTNISDSHAQKVVNLCNLTKTAGTTNPISAFCLEEPQKIAADPPPFSESTHIYETTIWPDTISQNIAFPCCPILNVNSESVPGPSALNDIHFQTARQVKRIAKDIKSSPYIPVTGAFIYSEKDNDPLNGYPLGFLPFRPKLLRSKKTFFKGDPATNEAPDNMEKNDIMVSRINLALQNFFSSFGDDTVEEHNAWRDAFLHLRSKSKKECNFEHSWYTNEEITEARKELEQKQKEEKKRAKLASAAEAARKREEKANATKEKAAAQKAEPSEASQKRVARLRKRKEQVDEDDEDFVDDETENQVQKRRLPEDDDCMIIEESKISAKKAAKKAKPVVEDSLLGKRTKALFEAAMTTSEEMENLYKKKAFKEKVAQLCKPKLLQSPVPSIVPNGPLVPSHAQQFDQQKKVQEHMMAQLQQLKSKLEGIPISDAISQESAGHIKNAQLNQFLLSPEVPFLSQVNRMNASIESKKAYHVAWTQFQQNRSTLQKPRTAIKQPKNEKLLQEAMGYLREMGLSAEENKLKSYYAKNPSAPVQAALAYITEL